VSADRAAGRTIRDEEEERMPEDAWKWELQPGDLVADSRRSRYTVAGSMRREGEAALLPVIASGEERVTVLRAEQISHLIDDAGARAELEAAAAAAVEELSAGKSVHFRSWSPALCDRVVELCAERGLEEPLSSMDSDMEGMHMWIRRPAAAPPRGRTR
jgi:hypothetical protein